MVTLVSRSIKPLIIRTANALLILLWVYAASSKLLDFQESKREMLNQAFTRQIALILTWAVPATELCACVMLLFPKTRLAGLYSSLALLLCFSIYIILVLLNVFGRVPCSCGGVLEKMGWASHLAFNICFLLLTALAIYFITNTKGAPPMGKEG